MEPSPVLPGPAGPSRAALSARVLIRLRSWRFELAAIALLLALALLLSIRQLVLGGTFYDDDILLMSIPVYSWYADQLKHGVLPLWSPALLGGAPLAFVIYDFFYPPDILLAWLLDGARAFHLSLALHLALAGGCCYWYCRVLGMRRLPALLAAVAFQMGNEVLSWQSNGFITKALFALPALLAAVELTLTRNRRHWLLVPWIVGAALLAGHPQAVLSALATGGAYAVVSAAVLWRRSGALRTLSSLALLALGVALGLGLSAVRIAPTLALAGITPRGGGLSVAGASIDSIDPWALLAGNLLPAVFEVPGLAAARPDYVGIPVLALAGLAALSLQKLDRPGRFHLGLAVVATVLSLGEFTPAYGLLLRLPFFSLFREPSRLSVVAAFGLAVLAGYALDRRMVLELPARKVLNRIGVVLAGLALAAGIAALVLSLAFEMGRDPLSNALRDRAVAGGWDLLNLLRPRVGIAVLGIVATPLLLLLAARRRLSHGSLEASCLGLTAATLFLLGWAQQSWLPPAELYAPPALLKDVRGDPGRFRVFSWAPRISTYNVGAYYDKVVGYPPSQEFEERYLRQFIPPNLGMLFGVDSAEWYDALQTRRQALAASYMGSERSEPARYSDGNSVDWKVYTLGVYDRLNFLAAMNVGYLMHAFPLQDPRLELVDQVSERIYPQFDPVARVYLYRLKNALPRALVVPAAEVIPGEKDVLDTLMAGTVDLHQKVILEQKPPALVGPPLTTGGSSVDIADYRDDAVTVRARTDGSGFLVLMDFLLPGWTATVDGSPEPILAANFAGRAVALNGPGEHTVQFRYEAPLLREGLAVSVASLLVVAIPLTSWGLARRSSITR